MKTLAAKILLKEDDANTHADTQTKLPQTKMGVEEEKKSDSRHEDEERLVRILQEISEQRDNLHS